ncbi:hypothetical protein LXL04_016264 [Taraxacum kok-saghyz]
MPLSPFSLKNQLSSVSNGFWFLIIIIHLVRFNLDSQRADIGRRWRWDGSKTNAEVFEFWVFRKEVKVCNWEVGSDGNGFKTSTMRLGADVIVFSCYLTDMTLTQSIGLQSYTFLTQSGYDRIVVPMVHYEFNFLTGCFDPLQTSNENLSVILKWSPFSTEEELLKQFEDVGSHGTKVIIYNLWLDEDGTMELDIESDPEDICIAWDGKGKVKEGSRMAENEQHISNRLKYSLRVISLLKSIYILS